ncbi:protein kinase family protein [Gammaproteobacteria bacterium]|nr:protein kinase family protein [Gammaproteobacteria bacterium]
MANVGLLFEKSRDFSWTDEQQKNAFANAKYTFDTDKQFQDIPDDQVKKIKREKISPTCWPIQQSIDTNSIHSFIKIENQVYATLAKQKGGVLGQGSFGTVRLAIDENGKQHAIKVENTSNGYDDPKIFQKNEVMINYDLGNGISKNVSYRYQPKTVPQKHQGEIISQQGKYYSVQKMLGMNLYEFLKINQDSLTDQQRLKLALQVCKLVEQLHLGTHSKEHKPFAHCDIKPENFTIDRNFKVTLVDFGLSTTEINTLPKGLRGTPAYLPLNYKQTTHQAHDIFALKRSLFCSERSSDIDGKSLLSSGLEETSILTRQFLQKHPALKKMISTFENLAYPDDNIQDIYAQLRGIEEQLSASADDKEVSTFTDTNEQTPPYANNLTTYLNRPLSKQDDFQPSRFPSERRISPSKV